MSVDSVKEFGLNFISTNEETKKWRKNLYNKNLDINRGVVCAALAAVKESLVDKEFITCFDGTGGCGVHSMLWQKYLGEKLQITVNDIHPEAVKIITQNLVHNNLQVAEILNEDSCIVLRKKIFDFIYLNCDTTASQYFDSVFSNLHENAVLVITTSEDSSLYWQVPEVALRNYNGVLSKTSYHREFAVRLVIAEMARIAAKYSKGIQILCTVAYKHQQSFTIVLTVKKSAAEANSALKSVQKLLHCNVCEERVFLEKSDFVVEHVSSCLACDCAKTETGKVTLELGPLWSGQLFCSSFVEAMLKGSQRQPWLIKTKTVLSCILSEANCGKGPVEEPPYKKWRGNGHPSFYYNTHRHSPKDQHLRKMARILEMLKRSGFVATRTHFDPEAVRTDASLKQLLEVLSK